MGNSYKKLSFLIERVYLDGTVYTEVYCVSIKRSEKFQKQSWEVHCCATKALH